MDAREQRGLVIAALCKLNKTDEGWLVPSQTGAERIYRVDPEKQTCTCPDHQEAGFKCKHLHAVEYTIKREYRADGTVIETKTLTLTERKTYKQDWTAYNEAQQTEKHRFQALLHDLCRGIDEPPSAKTGRKRMPMCDMVFACAFKVYSTFSARRFACDLADAFDKGYLSRLMNSVSVCAYLESESMTAVLQELIVQSSLPLRTVETDFAPDSSGFSVSRFVRWFDEKYGVTRSGHDWVKAHVMTGVKTNIVTAVRIEDRDAADCPQLKPLVEKTAENFVIREVSADKAYLSVENVETVALHGGTPFIAPKVNTTGASGGLFEKMFHYYSFNRDEFLRHYHLRSNAESTFSMVKAKFRDSVRSKTDVAMKNEVYCKFLCHNLCVLIQSQCELGIEPVFWTESLPGTSAVILPMKKHV
ncbi:MAG: transposase [Gemmataceae bacterium]